MQGWDTTVPIKDQFFHLMRNTFQYMIDNRRVTSFMEQYLNSPYGFTYMRDMILNEGADHSGEDPLRTLLEQARAQEIVKDLSWYILESLSFGPIFYLVRDIHAGLITIDAQTWNKIITACWDAVRR